MSYDRTSPFRIWPLLVSLCVTTFMIYVVYQIRTPDNKLIKHPIGVTSQQLEISTLKTIILNNALRIQQLEDKAHITHAKRVTVSFYCPKLGGINGSPNKSAIGSPPKHNWTVAVSRNLVEEGYFGCKIDVSDDGGGLPVSFRGIHFTGDKMARVNPYNGELIVDQVDIMVDSWRDIPKQGVFKNVLISRVIDYKFLNGDPK